MADNVTTPVAAGTSLATIEVDNVHIPKTVLVDETGDPIDLYPETQPISAASLPLPTGAATAALQATIAGHIDQVESILGTLATAAGVTTLIGHVDGLETQLTGIASTLTTIGGYLDGVETLLGGLATATGMTTLIGHVDGLEGSLTTIAGHLDQVETLLGTLATASSITTLIGHVDGIEGTLTTIAGHLDQVETLLAAATPAGENFIGTTGTPADLIDVTLSLDTSAYASGDVLADTQTIANAMRVNGGRGELRSIMVIDEDDQGQALDLVFLSANTTIGTENAAVSISDAGARDILTIVSIASADFIDLGGVRIASVKNIGAMLESAGGSRDLYVAAISRGTGTYTASGIRLRVGIIWA